jgi:hypothetical protein
MLQPESIAAGLGLGSSAAMLAFQVIDNGTDASVGVQSVLLGGAIGVFLFFDRRERRALEERNAERRSADVAKDAELKELRDEVRRLNAELLRIAKEGNGRA